MPAVTYHYKQLKGLRVPIITLAIRHGERWHPVEAYVDSGATYSVFTAQVAERLGLAYRSGRRTYVQVGDGGFIPSISAIFCFDEKAFIVTFLPYEEKG